MKIILQILLILLIVSTLSICLIKPEMHKNIIVYDSGYTIVPEKQIETEISSINVPEKQIKPIPVIKSAEQRTESKQTKIEQKQKIKETSTNTSQKTTHTQKTNVKTLKKPEENRVKNSLQTSVTKQDSNKSVDKQKILTQQEEVIAWNTWRSNLQNKIMQDTRLPILPNGTVFKFSFSVDKYGKISNVQTWAEPSNYTPYAIQYIAPAIRNCQGHSILNFPTGSERALIDFRGGWKISANEKYSSPSDYNDIEKVIK